MALTAFQGQNPRVGWQVGLQRDKTTPMCDPGACNARTFSPWANAPGPWCIVFTGQDKQLNHCCSGSQCAYSRYRNQCLYLIKACDRLIQGSDYPVLSVVQGPLGSLAGRALKAGHPILHLMIGMSITPRHKGWVVASQTSSWFLLASDITR